MSAFSRSRVINCRKLPEPNAWGDYWLLKADGKPDVNGPCILHSNEPVSTGDAASSHSWIASRGGEDGLLFEGGQLRRFASPEEALKALRES